MDTAPKILHVICRAGAGAAAAAESYISNTRDFEHHLLMVPDPTCLIGDGLQQFAASVVELPRAMPARIQGVRDRVRELRPDIIHAHSSIAGVLVRGVLARKWRRRVVYTPHCYSFIREDISRPTRTILWTAEAVLSLRGRYVAACSPLEARFARGLPGRQHVYYVPNVARRYEEGDALPLSAAGDRRVIVAAGRITAQKSPDLFAAAARLDRGRGGESVWRWIGGGDADAESRLRAAGVEVTGWVDRAASLRRLRDAHVYVHTASWEGAPLTLLEAVSVGLPVLARRIPALAALGVTPLWDTVEELVEMLGQPADGPTFTAAAASGQRLAEAHTDEAQRRALLAVYQGAAARAIPALR